MIISPIETGNSNNIKTIEKKLDLNLPLDYKNFLLKYNGAAINNAYFFIDEIKEMIMMGIFYGVDIEDSIDIIYNNKGYEDDLLKVAEGAAGGSLDNLAEIKPGWWEGTPTSGPYANKKIRVEWQVGGESVMNEGPHTKILVWDETAGKGGKGKWGTDEKFFIEGQETLW